MVVKIGIFRQKSGSGLGWKGKMRLAKQLDLSFFWKYQAEDALDGRGFASAVGSEVAEDLSLIHRKGDTFQDFCFFRDESQRESLMKILDVECDGH